MFLEPEVNGKLVVFMNIFHYHFDMCFPFKLVNQGRLQKKS
jgi:hypothetical protein